MTQPNTPPAPSAPAPTPAAPETPEAPSAGDKGFPEGTPLTEMTEAQQLAYWKHHARRHEDTVKAFKGLTPQQVADLQAENDSLKTEKMSADEKALKAARDEAFKQAQQEAQAQYLPQIQRSDIQRIAGDIVSGEKLKAFLDIVAPAKPDGGFHSPTAVLGEDGQVSEEKVMGYLTAMYGGDAPPPPAGPRWQNFGQHSPPPPPQPLGAAGAAAAEKRFGKKS
ncbi:hypothetical protein [Mycobacterium sp. TY813]|uniref:hypothetical protein n=1 Tax=Mycobacterium TaxID=1763 RepID=UPI002741E1E9|nr:hypothetical protein [Mycobacterium sp. TY813]MDP7729502.1 hypothetical protein [Mycobacterium sp. TY813]